MPSCPFRCLRAALLVAGLVLRSIAHAQAPPAQDRSLDNLAHAPGYRTSPLGTLGHVVGAGVGPTPMVLIPGLGFSGRVFDRFMVENAARYRMRAITLPGFGGTAAPPMPPAGTSYAAQTWLRAAAAAVGDLIADSLGAPAVLVAHEALGTQVALRLALDRPELVRGIVLVAGEVARPLTPGASAAMDSVQRRRTVDEGLAPQWFRTVTRATWDAGMWSAPTYSAHPGMAQRLWQEVQAVPVPVMVRYLCEYYAYDLTPELAALQAPVLVLQPGFVAAFAQDSFSTSARAFLIESWSTVLAGAAAARFTVVTVPESQMFVMHDQPNALTERVAAFVESLAPSPDPSAP